MKLNNSASDPVVLQEIGQRVTAARLSLNISRQALAEAAGIGLRTLVRLEAGRAATRLSTLIRVCRALGILENWDLCIPEPAPNPVDLLKLQGKARRRASRPRRPAARPDGWTWGEA